MALRFVFLASLIITSGALWGDTEESTIPYALFYCPEVSFLHFHKVPQEDRLEVKASETSVALPECFKQAVFSTNSDYEENSGHANLLEHAESTVAVDKLTFHSAHYGGIYRPDTYYCQYTTETDSEFKHLLVTLHLTHSPTGALLQRGYLLPLVLGSPETALFTEIPGTEKLYSLCSVCKGDTPKECPYFLPELSIEFNSDRMEDDSEHVSVFLNGLLRRGKGMHLTVSSNTPNTPQFYVHLFHDKFYATPDAFLLIEHADIKAGTLIQFVIAPGKRALCHSRNMNVLECNCASENLYRSINDPLRATFLSVKAYLHTKNKFNNATAVGYDCMLYSIPKQPFHTKAEFNSKFVQYHADL